jgi:hypothetical protein
MLARRRYDAMGRTSRRRTPIDVVREAGIAKRTVYLYFVSKNTLFAAVADCLCLAESQDHCRGKALD